MWVRWEKHYEELTVLSQKRDDVPTGGEQCNALFPLETTDRCLHLPTWVEYSGSPRCSNPIPIIKWFLVRCSAWAPHRTPITLNLIAIIASSSRNIPMTCLALNVLQPTKHIGRLEDKIWREHSKIISRLLFFASQEQTGQGKFPPPKQWVFVRGFFFFGRGKYWKKSVVVFHILIKRWFWVAIAEQAASAERSAVLFCGVRPKGWISSACPNQGTSISESEPSVFLLSEPCHGNVCSGKITGWSLRDLERKLAPNISAEKANWMFAAPGMKIHVPGLSWSGKRWRMPRQDEEWGYVVGVSRDDGVTQTGGVVAHISPCSAIRTQAGPPASITGDWGGQQHRSHLPTREMAFTKGVSITSETKKPGKQGWPKPWRRLREVSAYTE